jgi:flagellar hook protein FlgE
MSTNSALYTATSALNSQSTNLSIISTNLANSSTVGYKESSAYFSTLITDPYSSSASSSGGVMVSAQQHIDQQGLIEASSNSTDMAISGDGFFVVTGAADEDVFYYTRSGSFSTDEDGYLVNENGYYLQGMAVDSDGNYINGNNGSVSSLEPINLNAVAGSAEATENVSIVANLPADAEIGEVFTTSSEIFDSLGVSHTIDYSWEKTAENTWSLSYSDPVLSSDTTQTTGTTTGGPVTITFNEDGTLASTSVDPVEVSVTGWTTGAADSVVTYDLGTANGTDGLSQFASENGDDPTISITSVSQDGLRFGEFEQAYVDESGMVIAVFDNGQNRAIYQIPLADFNNPNGLQGFSNNVYAMTVASGDYTLNVPGYGGVGQIQGYALESSTVDTSEELTDMIIAQQAYSAASQVVSTTQDMFDDLMSATR